MHLLYHFRVRGGGAEGVHIAGIAEGLRALGHTVTFVSPTDADPTRPATPATPPPAAGGAADGAPGARLKRAFLHALADRLPQPLFELMELAYTVMAERQLARAWAIQPADAIYERYAFFNLAGARFARRRGIPLILEVNELSGLPRVRGQTFVRLAGACEKRVLRQAALIVVTAEFLKHRIGALLGDDRKVLVLPNGVARAWLEAASGPEARLRLLLQWNLSGRKIVGFVGGLVHWHNFDLLLRAAATARQTVPNLCLLLVGDGPLRASIEAEARRLGLTDALLITGYLPHAQVRAYIDLFDLGVIPQSNEFRSPIKLFEYMGAGKAVVAPAVEPIRAVVRPEATGLLFAPGDETAFVAALTALLTDDTRRRALGDNARAEVAAHYLWEHHARRIMEALHGALR